MATETDLQNIIKVTKEQYNILINGGTVQGYTYDPTVMYLIEGNTGEQDEYTPSSGTKTIKGKLVVCDEDHPGGTIQSNNYAIEMTNEQQGVILSATNGNGSVVIKSSGTNSSGSIALLSAGQIVATNLSGETYTPTDDKSITTKKYVDDQKYTTVGIGQNLVININGQQISGYKFGDIVTQGDYSYRQLQYSNGSTVSNIDDIKSYLTFMFGNNVLPEFNATKPYLCTFITTDSNNTVYKMQYDSSTYLRAYIVNNFPLATKNYVDTNSGTKVILNGVAKGAATASFYAPIASGTAGCELISDGVRQAPVWRSPCYATCITADSNNSKTASIANFKLVTGVKVVIKFKYAHTSTGAATLNIENTGAKVIKWNHTEGGIGTYNSWLAGETLELVYDGTYWIILRGPHIYEHELTYYFDDSQGGWCRVFFKVLNSSNVTPSFEDVYTYIDAKPSSFIQAYGIVRLQDGAFDIDSLTTYTLSGMIYLCMNYYHIEYGWSRYVGASTMLEDWECNTTMIS